MPTPEANDDSRAALRRRKAKPYVAADRFALVDAVGHCKARAASNAIGLLVIFGSAAGLEFVLAGRLQHDKDMVTGDTLTIALLVMCLLVVLVRALRVNRGLFDAVSTATKAAVAKDVVMGALLAAAADPGLEGRARALLNAMNDDAAPDDVQRAARAAIVELEALGRRDPATLP